jgi:hypothetical protein
MANHQIKVITEEGESVSFDLYTLHIRLRDMMTLKKYFGVSQR